METGLGFTLHRVHWQLFGSFTFKSERLPDSVRQRMWFAWLRQLGRRLHVPFPRLLWCRRQELGEITSRLHYHGLIAGLPPDALCPGLNFELMAAWQSLGGGWARVSIYQDDREGVGYLLKGLGYASDAERFYEFGKFGSQHCDLMLSNSAIRTLRRAMLPRHQTGKQIR